MCDIDSYEMVRDNLELACRAQGGARLVAGREALLALPRGWLLSRIGFAAEPVLAQGDAGEWRRLLELYQLLDPGLLDELARRAAQHTDPEIAGAGRDFLNFADTP